MTDYVARLTVEKKRLYYIIYGREGFGWVCNPLYMTCNDIKELVTLGFRPVSI
jgi:hypothetical protein